MSDYIRQIISRAWESSWTRVGGISQLVLDVLVFVTLIIIKRIQLLDLGIGGAITIIVVFVLVFIVIFVLNVFWEAKAVFPRIRVLPEKGIGELAIVIYNDEPVDLTDLEVTLAERRWVMRSGQESDSRTDPRNSIFKIDRNVIRYGGGSLVVKIAGDIGNNLGFLLDPVETPNSYEYYNNLDNARYRIGLKIKGKINNKTIFPKTFSRKIIYWRTEVDYPLGDGRIEHAPTHSLKWE